MWCGHVIFSLLILLFVNQNCHGLRRVASSKETDKNNAYNKEEVGEPVPIADSNVPYNENIELITVILRHGHRTPDSLYPKHPNPKETYFPYGFGELTNQGKRREYGIGKALRRRYNKFLGDIVGPDTLIARSSAILRAKRSLLLVLAGLYPPVGPLVWEPTVNWQAIPTSNLPLLEDNRFFGAWCPIMEQLVAEYNQTDEYKRTYNQFKEVFDFLTEQTGNTVQDYPAVMRLFFDFKGQKDLGIPLPEWSKNIFPHPMEEMAINMYKTLSATDEMIKYSGGFMMKKIVEEMLQKVEGKAPKERKVYLWSGHEINIAFVMRLLGVYYDHAPPFGAYITFELHNIKGNYGVKVLYENYEGPRLKVLKLPGCTEICPFFKFVSLIEKYLPTEEDKCDRITLDTSHIKLE